MCGRHTDHQLMSLRVSNSTRGTARKNQCDLPGARGQMDSLFGWGAAGKGTLRRGWAWEGSKGGSCDLGHCLSSSKLLGAN